MACSNTESMSSNYSSYRYRCISKIGLICSISENTTRYRDSPTMHWAFSFWLAFRIFTTHQLNFILKFFIVLYRISVAMNAYIKPTILHLQLNIYLVDLVASKRYYNTKGTSRNWCDTYFSCQTVSSVCLMLYMHWSFFLPIPCLLGKIVKYVLKPYDVLYASLTARLEQTEDGQNSKAVL